MKKYNICSLLNRDSDKTEEVTSEKDLNIKRISVYDLVASKDNFYGVEDIIDLKNSIEMFGIKQNLTVKQLEDGKYMVIAGHRRRLAILALVKEGKEEFELVPCAVEYDLDYIKEQLLLITTNSTARQLSDWEKTQQAKRMRELLEEYKKQNKLTGRMRELIADALNTSPSQVGRMESIEKNLSEEFKGEFKDQNINISAAYEISILSEDEQQKVLQKYESQGNITLKEIKEVKKETKSEAPAPVIEEEDKQEQTESLKNNYEKIKDMTIEQMAEFLYIHLSKKGLKKTLEWLKESEEKNEKNIRTL